jgi:hypothetical protein
MAALLFPTGTYETGLTFRNNEKKKGEVLVTRLCYEHREAGPGFKTAHDRK